LHATLSPMKGIEHILASRFGLSGRGVALLICAALFHASLGLSLRTGWWHRFTFDSTVTHGRLGWDFYALYQAGRNVLTGVSVYESADHLIDIVVPRHTPYRYLPLPACTLGVALNLVRAPVAYYLWVAFLQILLAVCAVAAWRVGGGGDRGAPLAAIWLLYTPVYLEYYMGQFSLVQAALILVMLLAAGAGLRRGHAPWRLNVAWAASLLWKQNTGLFAPLLLRQRRWRTLLVGGAAVVLLSAPYLIWYPEALGSFAGNLVSGPPGHQLGNHGVRQLLYGLSTTFLPAPDWPGHQLIQQLWVGLVLALTLWATWRQPTDDLVMPLCLWTASYFMLYHHVWEHHYVLLLPVYTVLLARERSPWLWLLLAFTAIWTPYRLIDPQGLAAVDASMRWTPLSPRWLHLLYHASKAGPTLVLWGMLWRWVAWGRAAWGGAGAQRSLDGAAS
jgi:hypothetical protein